MIEIQKRPLVDSDIIWDITSGSDKALLFFTAVEYDIFSHLKTPQSSEDLSSELDTDQNLTTKLLNCLVSLGLLTRKDELYKNTPVATTYLVKSEPFYQGNLIQLMKKSREERWAQLSHVLKHGPIETDRKLDNIFDKSFILAMAEGALRGGLFDAIESISKLPEFSTAKRLLDLGGGHGLYAIGFAKKNPNLETYVFDLPQVIDVTKQFISRYQMDGRVKTISGNFENDGWEDNYDIIFASDSLYRRKDKLIPILNRIKQSLTENGVFISKHWAMNEERTGPTTTVFFDLMMSMMGGFDSYIYSNEEFIAVLKEAGFRDFRLIDISKPSKPSIITVAKKGVNEVIVMEK